MGYIGRKAATTILHSARTAKSIGRPFTHFLTLRLWELGSNTETITADFAEVRQWFRRWSERASTRKGQQIHPSNGTATHIYAIESTGGLSTGEYPHVHWVIHLKEPNEDRFIKALQTRLAKQFHVSGDLPSGVMHWEKVTNAEGIKLYLVKAIDPLYADLWNIEHTDGGYVRGRRADASRNLGPRVWKPLKAEYKKTKHTKRSNKFRSQRANIENIDIRPEGAVRA